MGDLLEFLRTHEEAFRSRSRLASLYSDFRFQRNTNPDGYQANSSAWLRALADGAQAGLIPSPGNDRLVLPTGEELLKALQTQEFGRPLALGAIVEDAVKKKELIPLKEFLNAKQSVYTRSWIPTLGQVFSWGLRQIGVVGGEAAEDRLVRGDFVVMANVESAAKAVLDEISKIATLNSSRIFSKELFNNTFAPSLGIDTLSQNDQAVLLTHLARDRSAIALSMASGVVKFRSSTEVQPSPITEEDICIASLRSLMSSLEPQIQQLTTRMSELEIKAKSAVANKRMTAAKTALRQKKLADTALQQRTATLAQLEDVYAKIEQAADQVEIVKVMEASGRTLKSLNQQTGGVEKVQDVMDNLREEMTTVEEIGQAINDVSAGEIDEGAVEDELEALEQAEKLKQEEAERKEREKLEAARKAEQEKRDAEEAEKTRRRLAELDSVDKREDLEKEKNEGLAAQEVRAEVTVEDA